MSFRGHPPSVGIQRKQPNPLEEKAREILLDRTVVKVVLTGNQLSLTLDDGGMFTMSCEGGFGEVN